MKKISKSKKGFTLVEMVLVIAIICILAAVLFFSVSDYISKAKSATASIEAHNAEIEEATAEINAQQGG